MKLKKITIDRVGKLLTLFAFAYSCLFNSHLNATTTYIPNGNEYNISGQLVGDQIGTSISIGPNGGFVVWQDNSSDPFALSIMITDLTNKPASQIFYENAFKKFSTNNFMHWVSDKKGITVSQARLTMTAVDWSNFGQFVNDEMINDTCLGKFYKEGITNAVDTKRDGVKYGYQFWVYNVNGVQTLTMTGHGGFFNVVNTTKNTIRNHSLHNELNK